MKFGVAIRRFHSVPLVPIIKTESLSARLRT
ncbi:hypothetical protein ACHAXS_001759 [Conticribra weissflogii]